MGTTISRPFLHTVESSLLAVAYIIDSLVQFAERILSSTLQLCLAPTYRFSPMHGSPDTSQTTYSNDERLMEKRRGQCAGKTSARSQQDRRARMRTFWTIRRKDDRLERRKRRAEWAAAGLDPDRMEGMMRERKHGAKTEVKYDAFHEECFSSPVEMSPSPIVETPYTSHDCDVTLPVREDEPLATIRPVPRPSEDGRRPPLLVQPKPRRAAPIITQTVPSRHPDRQQISPAMTAAPQHLQNIFAHTRGASSLDITRLQAGKSRTMLTPETSRSTTPTNLGLTRTMTMPGILLEDASAASDRLGKALARGLTPPIFSGHGISRPQSVSSVRHSQQYPASSASSIAEARSTQHTPPPSAPPRVATMVDLACKSRWEANARERKVWKGEVNRIALQRLNEQQAAATSQQSHAKPAAKVQ